MSHLPVEDRHARPPLCHICSADREPTYHYHNSSREVRILQQVDKSDTKAYMCTTCSTVHPARPEVGHNAGPGLFQETLKSLLKETLGDHFYIKRRPKGDFLDLKRRPKFRLLSFYRMCYFDLVNPGRSYKLLPSQPCIKLYI